MCYYETREKTETPYAAMREKTKKKRKTGMIIVLTIVAIIVIFILFVLLYRNPPYPEAREIADQMEREDRDYWLYGDTGVGFIFFTGAEVGEPGYAYFAGLLHEGGHTVVIPKQTFQMSMFGTKHAIEIINEHPEVDKWILVGHSLGGVPVSRVAEAEPDHLIGLVYLAAYASVDLTDLPYPALRITADNDGVMNNEQMDGYAGNLPAGSESVMLTGANHRGFGSYKSPSRRDGDATLTWQEQNEQCATLIFNFYGDAIAEVEREHAG